MKGNGGSREIPEDIYKEFEPRENEKKILKVFDKPEDKFPFDIGPIHEGERIRKKEMFVELAGPKTVGFELVLAARPEDVHDMRVTIIGPDLNEMEEGRSYPFAMIYKVAGERIDKDLEGVIERRNHDFQNYIEGYMHLNQRYDIWCRISKKVVEKGLRSLAQIAWATMKLFKTELPFIEKMEAIYITDEDSVRRRLDLAMKVYDWRDRRVLGLREEDVDEFYGCTLCQSFAPTHVCVITPERVSICGAVTWVDARAAAKVDPDGPNFPIPKGEVIDPVGGEYSGVNEVVKQKSGGKTQRVKLHSFFEYPHTSCGCFETVIFYIPEVEGFGAVDRGFRGTAPNGMTFSEMAARTGGGIQTVGFLGVGIGYYRSRKFLQKDGGWKRIVWMSKSLKERLRDAMPADLVDKIATEEDVQSVEDLVRWVEEKKHPVLEYLRKEKAKEEKVEEKPEKLVSIEEVKGVELVPTAGGIKIILYNPKIKIEKVVIRRKE